jgi:hypothetical protein
MPCDVIERQGVGVALVCSRGPRRLRRCIVCQRSEAQTPLVLCDAVVRPDKVKGSRTCDAAVCARHAVHREPDLDYCPRHAQEGEHAMLVQGIRSSDAHDKKHHALGMAHSPSYAVTGQLVYVICGWGGCPQRLEVDEKVWREEEARRRTADGGATRPGHA